MDAREAFKYGFIANCLTKGISEFDDMIKVAEEAQYKPRTEEKTKQADESSNPFPSPSTLWNTPSALAGWAMPVGIGVGAAALLLPFALGKYIGTALGHRAGELGLKGSNPTIDPADVDTIKRQEYINEYQRQAQRLRRFVAERDKKKDSPPAYSPY